MESEERNSRAKGNGNMFNVNPLLYSRLSNSDKKIADFFIEHEEEVLKSSIHELAQLIGVSSSSISRFVRKINGSSFSQTKVEMAKSHMQDIYTKSSEVISLADDLEALPGKLLTQINIACEDVVRLNSQKSFEATIDLLEKAEVVYFFGVGTSGLIAVDLQQKLIKIGKKCIYHYDSNFGVLNATTTTPNDVVIAISYTGKTREILLPVRRSKENG
ncbi:MAG: MurR/RpiR family transcriptional regulator, partial [Deltaproteobacteria bacterium]|nr:MurR/RpiR family transcriptional regulator [Deltaproteobacteria bacterium]